LTPTALQLYSSFLQFGHLLSCFISFCTFYISVLPLKQHQPKPQHLETFDVNQLTADVCTDSATHFLNRGVSFEFKPSPHQLLIEADKTFVVEAIRNLIDNVLQHGGPHLSAVVVSTSKQAENALISVYDNGTNLTPADTKKAFGRFSQIEPGVGSGLGLAIADSVAQRHGGELTIGTVEKGAQLNLMFPLESEF